MKSAARKKTDLPPITRPRATFVDAGIKLMNQKPGKWILLRTASLPSTAQSYAAFLRERHEGEGYDFTTRENMVWGRKEGGR